LVFRRELPASQIGQQDRAAVLPAAVAPDAESALAWPLGAQGALEILA
jgi:hypothetical protein